MTDFLKNKKSAAAAVAFAAVLLVLRCILFDSGVEYPSNLYANGSDMLNLLYNGTLVAALAVISVLAYFDCKNTAAKSAAEISQKGANALGFIMIIGGAALFLPFISSLSNGGGLLSFAYLAGMAGYIAGGCSMLFGSKISAAHCISAVFIILCYLLFAVAYYLSNAIILGNPQKNAIMIHYVLTVLFWLNTGRYFSSGHKRLTLTAAVSSGFVGGAAAFAYVLSSFVLAAMSPDKWMMLADTPDIELIITGFVPCAMAAVMLMCKKREESGSETGESPETAENAEAAQNEGENPQENQAANSESEQD